MILAEQKDVVHHSRRSKPTSLSTCAFAVGARTGVQVNRFKVHPVGRQNTIREQARNEGRPVAERPRLASLDLGLR